MTLVPRRIRKELAPRRFGDSDPWNALLDLESFFNRAIGETGGDFFEGFRSEWAPAVDVSETDDAYVVEADIPGMRKEDIKIEVENDVLTIRGERKSEKEEKDEKKGYHRVERRMGAFVRSLRVPGGVKAEDVSAKFQDGVLKVTLPKPEESKPKLITVKAE